MLTVYFLHGSRPAKGHEATEPRWFGGKMGGHVGIGWAHDSILHFLPQGKFHVWSHRKDRHSRFVVSDYPGFLQAVGPLHGAAATTIIHVPVSDVGFADFQSGKWDYLQHTPYDYAFLGMRCASATRDMLARADVLRTRRFLRASFGTFHPKVLRRKLLRRANREGWTVITTKGSGTRTWQR